MEQGRDYASTVMSNPHPYRAESSLSPPEVEPEWIERTLVNPYAVTADERHPGRTVYYSYIPEAGAGKWLLVVVQDDQLFNAYFNHNLLSRRGRPE